MYKAIYYLDEIIKVELVSQTKSFITVRWPTLGSYREKRQSENHSYHKTFEEAKAALVSYHRDRLERMELQLKYYRGRLEKVSNLTITNITEAK